MRLQDVYKIDKNKTLTVIKFDYDILPIYIVEDNKRVQGSSRINEKRALYNYNRNKKRKGEKKNGRKIL